MALPVDQNETAQRVVFGIRFECNGMIEINIAIADFVQLQAMGSKFGLRVYIYLVLD